MDPKKRDLISIVVAMAGILAMLVGATPSTGKAGASIERAQAILADPARREAEVCNAVGAIFDAAATVADSAHVNREAKAKLTEAQQAVAAHPSAFAHVETLVQDSYALLHGGTKFAMPKDLRTTPAIIERIQARLSHCRQLLEKGDPENAVAVLVEVLAMVLTPVHAELS